MKAGQGSVAHARQDDTFGPGREAAARDREGSAGGEAEIENSVRPMLEAVVRMAGAAAGAIRLVGNEPGVRRAALAVGLPASGEGLSRGPFAVWCSQCAESRNPQSDCVRDRICGAGEDVSGANCGAVCRHVVAVPLRYRDATVGMLDLHFHEACALAPQTMPMLRATGELIGVALENARLTRENLHASLTGERQMMANEVHDSLAQALTYMRMRMSVLRDAIKQGDELRAFKYWGDVDDSLTNAHARLRELITSFRSSMDPHGLQHALADAARTFVDRTGIALDFENRAPDLRLPVACEVQAFHIVQEALANVCNHSKASAATLLLERVENDCEVTVEDDGIGMPVGSGDSRRSDSGHYGIEIMRERARRIGGTLTIGSAGRTGTRVRLSFPVMQQQTERSA